VDIASEFRFDRDRSSGDLSSVVPEGLLRSSPKQVQDGASASYSTTLTSTACGGFGGFDETLGGYSWAEEPWWEMSAWDDLRAAPMVDVVDDPISGSPPGGPESSCMATTDVFGLEYYSLSISAHESR